ncbi:MAG: hypothetical protein ACKOB8_05440 [Mycobacterium sp.]
MKKVAKKAPARKAAKKTVRKAAKKAPARKAVKKAVRKAPARKAAKKTVRKVAKRAPARRGRRYNQGDENAADRKVRGVLAFEAAFNASK